MKSFSFLVTRNDLLLIMQLQLREDTQKLDMKLYPFSEVWHPTSFEDICNSSWMYEITYFYLKIKISWSDSISLLTQI